MIREREEIVSASWESECECECGESECENGECWESKINFALQILRYTGPEYMNAILSLSSCEWDWDRKCKLIFGRYQKLNTQDFRQSNQLLVQRF